jgi:hypothetical protein
MLRIRPVDGPYSIHQLMPDRRRMGCCEFTDTYALVDLCWNDVNACQQTSCNRNSKLGAPSVKTGCPSKFFLLCGIAYGVKIYLNLRLTESRRISDSDGCQWRGSSRWADALLSAFNLGARNLCNNIRARCKLPSTNEALMFRICAVSLTLNSSTSWRRNTFC